jgi:hypothetical protein
MDSTFYISCYMLAFFKFCICTYSTKQILGFNGLDHVIKIRTEFGYKLIYSQLTTNHYLSTNKIIHVYFNHMTYLMSHVTSLNNTYERSYKLPHSGL